MMCTRWPAATTFTCARAHTFWRLAAWRMPPRFADYFHSDLKKSFPRRMGFLNFERFPQARLLLASLHLAVLRAWPQHLGLSPEISKFCRWNFIPSSFKLKFPLAFAETRRVHFV